MKPSAFLFCCVLTAGSRSAFAQGVDDFGGYGQTRERRETGQQLAVELRFGRYIPAVDSQVHQGDPFARTFGNDNRYLIGLEVDWQAIRIPMFGTIGPGIGWGYTRASEEARFEVDPNTRSKEKTTLNVMPFYLVGVVRADVFSRDFGIPIVPYAKLGLGYALWWSRLGDKMSRVDGDKASGSSYGWQYALGGMLHLDPLDPETASGADAAVGINNSYAFIEWYRSDLDGFGAGDQMQVGTNTWMLGVAVEL